MELDVMRPETLIDINALGREYGRIEADASGLRLGGLVRMAEAAQHPAFAAITPCYPTRCGWRRARNCANGNPRRQRAAAHAPQLFPRYRLESLQQARARLGLRRARRLQ